MKTETILERWDEDSRFDTLDIKKEALKGLSLHSKYIGLYRDEKILLKRMESDFAVLKLEKFQFYTEGPDENTPKDWDMRGKRKLKSEVSQWIDTDPDIIKLSLKVAAQFEKVEVLKSILSMIFKRSFDIKNYLEALKFENGM